MDKFFNFAYNIVMKRFLVLIMSAFLTVLPALAEESANPAETKAEQAKLLYADNNISESFDLLISIPENDRTAENWLLLGNILQDKGRSEDAVFMYTKAILKDAKFYKAYYNLGNSYLEDNKPNLAIEQYKKVLKLKDDYAYAYYNMGCAYIKLGKFKQARNAFLDAIYFKNAEPDFHYNLAYVYKKLGKQKDAEAYLQIYNKLMENKIE